MNRRLFLRQSALACVATLPSPLFSLQADYPMKPGVALRRPNLDRPDDMRFVRQLGVTHVVTRFPLLAGRGIWEFADLLRLRTYVESFGLKLEAIENFPQSFWHKILLGEQGRDQQMENLKQTVRNVGKAGIPILGYYFSLARVWGHWRAYTAGGGRGGAGIKSFDYERVKDAPSISRAELLGVSGGDAPAGSVPDVGVEEMWRRFRYFLENLVPVAEEAGVKLAAHPDDPPVPILRNTGRLLTSHDAYQRMVDLAPSPSNGMEFCQGTVTEMGEDIYDAIRRFGGQKKIFYVHFRNVRGDFPTKFDEVFIDEGDVDMIRAMRTYRDVGYDGVMIPDHSPLVRAPGSWHAGIAFALGYMKAAMQAM